MKILLKFIIFVFFIGVAVFATFEIQKQNPLRELEKEITGKIAILEKENAALEAERDKLIAQLLQAAQEAQNLKARLSSEEELNKAIDQIKWQARKVGMEIQERVKDDQVGEGNRGVVSQENGKEK